MLLLSATYPDPRPLHEICFNVIAMTSLASQRDWRGQESEVLASCLPQRYLVKLTRRLTLYSYDIKPDFYAYRIQGIKKTSCIDKLMAAMTSRCSSLTALTLTQCKLSAPDLQHLIGALPNLVTLDLSATSCDERVVMTIGATCNQLTELRLVGCPSVNNSAIAYLCPHHLEPGHAGCPRLTLLDLRNCCPKISPIDIVKLLEQLTGLRQLYSPQTCKALEELTFRCPDRLCHLKLTHYDCAYPNVSLKTLRQSLTLLQDLRSLFIRVHLGLWAHSIQPTTYFYRNLIGPLGEQAHLRSLSLENGRIDVTDLRECHNLVELHLCGVGLMSDRPLRPAGAEAFTPLQVLRLIECHGLSDDILIELMNGAENLKHIMISGHVGCKGMFISGQDPKPCMLTDRSLSQLTHMYRFSCLSHVHLANLDSITIDSVRLLLPPSRHGCQVLLESCSAVTSDDLKHAVEMYQWVRRPWCINAKIRTRIMDIHDDPLHQAQELS